MHKSSFCIDLQVKSVLKKKFYTLRENRTLATRCTKTSIGWANDVTIHKDMAALTNGDHVMFATPRSERIGKKLSNNNSRDDGLETENML